MSATRNVSQLENVLSRLDGVKEYKGYTAARCPAHDDKNPSLSVRKHDDGISVKCHAGCSTDEILQAIGMTRADLRPRATLVQNGHRETRPGASLAVARSKEDYYYQDENGDPLFRVRRTSNKNFIQQRYEDGEYINGLGGREPVPYHLDKIANQYDKTEPLFICEGEKDTDRLIAEGPQATTNPMGAGKWREEYADHLRGFREIYVVADNDAPGRKHAEQVTATLPQAKIVHLPGLPEKGDVSDWLDAGHSPEELLEIARRDGTARSSTRFEPADLREAILNGLKRPEMLIREMMYEGLVHGLYAAGGMGKTWMALWIIKQAIEQRKKVLLLDLENGTRIIADRLRSLGVDPELVQKYLRYCPFPSLPLSVDASTDFEALLDEFQPDLIVVDSWINCLAAAGLDENSSTDIARWTEAYTQRARARSIAVLILDHEPKEGGSARGSGRKLDYVDVMWELKNPVKFNRETTGRVDLRLKKDREGWLPRGLTFTVGPSEDGTLEFSRSLVAPLSANETTGLLQSDRMVLEALQEIGNGGAFDKDWREKAMSKGLGRTTYYRSRGTLMELGYAEKVINKYFPKTPAKPTYQEVPSESHGTNGTSAFGEESHESHHPKGWDSWDYQADTPEEQVTWIDDEEETK